MNPYKRHERLEELLHQEVSKIVQTLKDPKLGFVTVTGLELSQDLRDARVYYSVLGTDEDKQHAKKTLEDSTYRIRHTIGRLPLRHIPKLSFVYDDTPERASRVFHVLNELERQRQSQNGSDPSPA